MSAFQIDVGVPIPPRPIGSEFVWSHTFIGRRNKQTGECRIWRLS